MLCLVCETLCILHARYGKMIYLDNAATTKMFASVAEIMKKYACDDFFNPSAGYGAAISLSGEVDRAREALLKSLGASRGEIIFTSGATESNNLAILGSFRSGNWEYVFSAGEHPSVYNTALALKEKGARVHFVPLKNGQIDYAALENVVNEKTRLVSVIHVSNETGAINDIARVRAILNKKCPKALLHVDGVQAFCKIPFKLDDFAPDLYTISAHKFHGPKGVGALYVKNKDGLKNIVYGGGQEQNRRSGTLNVPGIMGMAAAALQIDVEKNFENVKALKKAFLDIVLQDQRVSALDFGSPYIVSLQFEGVNGETLMRAVENEVIISTGSACSAKYGGNRVLEQNKLPPQKIKSSVRVSFNAYLSVQEVKSAAHILLDAYHDIYKKVN